MTVVLARKALPHKGWTDDIRIGVRRIGGLDRGVAPAFPVFVAGCNIAGPRNAHSHAFQRGSGG